MLGIVLHRNGWRYLGANTPAEDLAQVTADTGPNLVVLATTTPGRLAEAVPELARLAGMAPLALAGAGGWAGRVSRCTVIPALPDLYQ